MCLRDSRIGQLLEEGRFAANVELAGAEEYERLSLIHISRAWSGMNTRQYKRFKGLKKENLRDNMSTTEIVLNMLAEASTKDMLSTPSGNAWIFFGGWVWSPARCWPAEAAEAAPCGAR